MFQSRPRPRRPAVAPRRRDIAIGPSQPAYLNDRGVGSRVVVRRGGPFPRRSYCCEFHHIRNSDSGGAYRTKPLCPHNCRSSSIPNGCQTEPVA